MNAFRHFFAVSVGFLLLSQAGVTAGLAAAGSGQPEAEIGYLARLSVFHWFPPPELQKDLESRKVAGRNIFEDAANQAWMKRERAHIVQSELLYFKENPDDPLARSEGAIAQWMAIHKGLAHAGLAFYDKYPGSPLRWDGVALAYGQATEYGWKASDAADPFLASPQYRRIDELAEQALRASDIDPVVFAHIVAAKASRAFRSYNRDRSAIRASQERIEGVRVQLAGLLQAVEQKFPDKGSGIVSRRYEVWSADDAYRDISTLHLELLQSRYRYVENPADKERYRDKYWEEVARISGGRFPLAAAHAQNKILNR